MSFSKKYPHVAWWIENHGWVELGADEGSTSLIRILDEGGLCWEDEESDSIDDALKSAEAFLKEEMLDRFGETIG
jgi:hypothetical protein